MKKDITKRFGVDSIIDIDKYLSEFQEDVIIEDGTLTLPQIISVARTIPHVSITSDPQILVRIQDCYNKMIEDIKNGVPIYGGNTGYGARASNVLTEGVED
ncbi:MAG TPA: aromatic amino acid lyase, partial [Verrucomicrobiae bacterium]|nr:aromatic amino acid lyase [Verrucomicrobiae bacterium]